jgi:hypothetical protein
MTIKPKLNDLQLILLSHAANQASRSVLPLPSTVADAGRADKELKSLLRRGLLIRTETTQAAEAWRNEGDLSVALLISGTGMAALGLADEDEGAGSESNAASSGGADDALAEAQVDPVSAPQRQPRADSKIAKVLALLSGEGGASLAQLIEATGWLPHTTRAALTGLRKKGHTITRTSREGVTIYSVGQAA